MRWFTKSWWKYLLAKRDRHYSDRRDWPRIIWCRLRGRPHNVYWYNVSGDEPNMHCQNCGDDLA